MRPISHIVLHCSTTPNGLWINAECLDHWHAARGFKRDPRAAAEHEPTLRHIGHHWVIYTTGSIRPGRHPDEPGAPSAGSGREALNICLIGATAFTPHQWSSLAHLVSMLRQAHPAARICGHRDVSQSGCEGDGTFRPCAKVAQCPGFSVSDWLAGGLVPLPGHVFEGGGPCR